MKLRNVLWSVLLVLTVSFFVHAEEAPKKQPVEKTELEGKMDVMGKAWKKLKRQVADASQNPDSLQLVATIRTAAEDALKLIPARVADVPAADQAKFMADYQAGIRKLIASFGKLEAALSAGKNDEAVKLVAEISVIQKAGHNAFERPDEKK